MVREYVFPSDILRIIKGFQYSLESYQRTVNKIKFSISYTLHQPYVFGDVPEQTDENQLFHIDELARLFNWYNVLSKTQITEFVLNENHKIASTT